MPLFGSKISDIMNNRKIEREISDLESRKQSLVRSLQNEISALQSKISSIYLEIGEDAYTASQNGEFTEERFAGKLTEITALKETIGAREAKITEICNRYDEEITLLRNLNPTAPASAEIAPAAHADDVGVASAGNCGSCGTPRGEGDIFCKNCGNKLT